MIYIFLAPGFETAEALVPLDVLRRAEADVKLVGVGGSEIVSAHGLTVRTDISLDKVRLEDCEMLILPGGADGTKNLSEDKTLRAILLEANGLGILIAAICAAPTILAELGILRGKRAVCYPTQKDKLTKNGVKFLEDSAVARDGNIITGQGAGASFAFAFELVTMIRGWSVSENIRKSMLVNSSGKSLT